MSIESVLADLEEFREEHERLTRSERSAREGVKVLQAENAQLRERPVDLKRLQAQVRTLRSDLSLANREMRVITNERDALVKRLSEAREEAQRTREHASDDRSDELRQAHRRLAVAIDMNTRLSAQVAEMQEQVRQAEQMTENSRRALLDHAGRT